MVTYNNDEPIQLTNEDITSGQGVAVTQSNVGPIQLKLERKEDVTNQVTKFPVLIEVTGAAHGEQRMGVDIVAVLDTSTSMNEQNKLEKMKRAMTFIIQKLSPNDRLSIVTFSSEADLLCNLRQMTEDAKVEIGVLVRELDTTANTNTAEGLSMALQVLNDRRLKTGRAMAIMLMSDGVQNMGPKAESISLGDIPVHTFGFGSGQDYNPAALNKIAYNSIGGTFSYAEVRDTDYSNLSTVFSQCLAGLHSIVVQELKITVKPQEFVVGGVRMMSMIQKVFGGDYIKTINPDHSVTILFGDLYQQEVRKIVVEILLPAVEIEHPTTTTIIGVSSSYRVASTVRNNRPVLASVMRTTTPLSNESDALKAEILRIETLEQRNTAVEKAEEEDFTEATNLLINAQVELDAAEFDEANASIIDALKQEVDIMLKYMEHEEIYDTKGRPSALSTRTSHGRQRFAGRGDDVGNIRSHATPRMDALYLQAEAFEQGSHATPRMDALYLQAEAFEQGSHATPRMDALYLQAEAYEQGSHATPRMDALYLQDEAFEQGSHATPRMDALFLQDEALEQGSHATPRMEALLLQAKAFEQDNDP